MTSNHEVCCLCPACDRKWQAAYKEVSEAGKKRVERLSDNPVKFGRPWRLKGQRRGGYV